MSPRSTRTPFCAERAPQNGGFSLFDVSWFVFLFSLVKTNDDDSDEGKLYFMMETHRSCGMASRGIRCLSRYIRITVCPWRVVHSSGNQAVKQRLRCHRVCYNHAYVFTLVRRERYFCPFRFRVF